MSQFVIMGLDGAPMVVWQTACDAARIVDCVSKIM
jgi:hypothetical protein